MLFSEIYNENKLTQESKEEADIEIFKQITIKYIDFNQLITEIINNLTSYLTVRYVKDINDTKFKGIMIIYKFR
ncbi:MAG: hypothetical protein SOY54_03735 [Bacilli bacterium]|nr:hypothetical protein [Bacilli bacterium]